MLFKNRTHQDIWIEHNCGPCYRDPDDCPILAKALKTGRKPPEWERKPREIPMSRMIKCESFAKRPPLAKAPKQFEDVAMFDVDPQPVNLVPVDGWPNRPNKKGTDHA